MSESMHMFLTEPFYHHRAREAKGHGQGTSNTGHLVDQLAHPTPSSESRIQMRHRHSPLDDEDLLQEIFLRLPPKLCSFPRASLVCKRWRSILSDPRFLRRFRKHHRKPTLIGFFDRQLYQPTVFTPILHPPNRIPATRFVLPENLFALEPHATSFSGCCHGIALFLDRYRREAVLWHPLTGVQHRVAFPPAFQGVGRFDNIIRSTTVLCPVGDNHNVHNDCHMSPFKLVFAWHGATSTQTFVCVYESKFSVWGDVISIVTTHVISQRKPSILVGNALCWLLLGGDILEFDFERLTLAVIKKPAGVDVFNVELSFQILRGEDNGLGLAVLAKSEPNIQLWARKSDSDGVVSWLLQTTVQLDQLFSKLVPGMSKLVLMSGYDEDTNMLFLSSVLHDYIIQLQSMQFNFIGRRELKSFRTYHPYTHFYNAVIRGAAVGMA